MLIILSSNYLSAETNVALEKLGPVIAYKKSFQLDADQCLKKWNFNKEDKSNYGGCYIKLNKYPSKDEFLWRNKAALGSKKLAPGLRVYWEAYPNGYSLQLSSEDEISSYMAFHYLKEFIREKKELSVIVLKINN